MKLIHDDERLDDLHRKGYRILQKPGAFCFGMDAVLLADFAVVKKKEQVLDLGTGTGIIPILMQARHEDASYVGLELQPDMADMASRSVLYNHQEQSVRIVQGDLRRIRTWFPPASMDVVTANPPYMKAPAGLTNQNEALTIARHEVECVLSDVTAAASDMLKFHGRFYMVHRPRRLVQILEELRRVKLEPKRMRLVHPYYNKEPNMVLIEAVRGGGEELRIQPPLIIYDAPGRYSDEIYRIYGYERKD